MAGLIDGCRATFVGNYVRSGGKSLIFGHRFRDGVSNNGCVRCEAVAIDLPGGAALFALLTSADGDADYARQLPGRALGSRLSQEPANDKAYRWRDVTELWPTHPDTIGFERTNPLPRLIRFRDPNDPRSGEEVAPGKLAAVFGPGVRLKRITIEKTSETVTGGIEKRLRWLDHLIVWLRHIIGTW
ncbi:hypothetical protein [Sphingobium sp. YR768]|uniref:hypothetical protein n=1 Tax=Sphingobium sp. YR768 TaxID=1884365 RepID=UPI000B89C1DA|nr:hypothetical protein [Sphingobium sp. YR768]